MQIYYLYYLFYMKFVTKNEQIMIQNLYFFKERQCFKNIVFIKLVLNFFRLHDQDEKIRKIKGKKRRGVDAEIKDEKSILKYF